MTRRDFIHKWTVYALGLLPVWLLDAYILPRVPLWGTVVPMLLPLAAAAVAGLGGGHARPRLGMAGGPPWGAGLPRGLRGGANGGSARGPRLGGGPLRGLVLRRGPRGRVGGGQGPPPLR